MKAALIAALAAVHARLMRFFKEIHSTKSTPIPVLTAALALTPARLLQLLPGKKRRDLLNLHPLERKQTKSNASFEKNGASTFFIKEYT